MNDAPFEVSRRASALIALRRIVRATELNSRALAKESGLNPSQLILMNMIAVGGKITPSSAAREMSLSQATITALSHKLEERGLVERRGDEADKRRVFLALTQAGQAVLNDAPDMLQARFSTRFDALADWEQAGLIASLERIAMMLDAEGMDAAPVLDVGSIRTVVTPEGVAD